MCGKLIDTDELKRRLYTLIKELVGSTTRPVITEESLAALAAYSLIDDMPAVDAAQVVRCKDCRYYNTIFCGDGFGWCERTGIGHGTSDGWFCADGEVKNEQSD